MLRGERGQTLLEFAFVAPLVLFFLLGLVDFGIAIDRRLVLDHAVREGARFASVGGNSLATGVPATKEDVQEYTEAQAQGIIAATDVRVCYDVDGGVVVSATYQHDFVTGFTSLFDIDLAGIEMTPSGTARVEQLVSGVTSCLLG